MAKKQNTDLKLSIVKKQADELKETAQYELEDGHTITFSPLFGDLQIEVMLEELQQHHITMKDKGIELSEKMNLYFINLLIIKHFTHFKSDMPNELLAVGKKVGLLDWLNHFADTGLMKIIMDEVFVAKEVRKVYDKLTEFLGTTLLLNELSEMTQRKVDNMRFKHSDAISKIENNVVQ